MLINQSGLMRWADTPYSYLAMTKESVYSDEPQPLEPRPGSDSRYLFVYPMWKKREWYTLAARGADADHEGPHRDRPPLRPESRSTPPTLIGLDDQEFVVSFNGDDPGEFLDLVQELRGTESSAYTLSETPDLHLHLARRAGEGPRRTVNDEIRDITVIGAGPVGMVTAFWAGMREASSRIVESLPELGGQLTTLYPEKWIFDVPGFPRIIAKDLVEELRKQSLEQFDVPVLARDHRRPRRVRGHRTASAILRLVTDKGDFLSRTIDHRRRPRRVRAEEAAGLRHDARGRARAPTTSSARSPSSPARTS